MYDCLVREHVLKAELDCSAGGRDISEDLAPHWRRLLIQLFGPQSVPKEAEDTDEGRHPIFAHFPSALTGRLLEPMDKSCTNPSIHSGR